jgi:hypothetical protein
MKRNLLGAFLLMVCWSGGVHAAPVLQITGGILTGAGGVNVNGTLYAVSFQDGTCIGLFSGCDSSSDFAFGGTSASAAFAASQALLDQVFLDGPLGNFDSNPALTRGCADGTGAGFCAILTPVDFLVNNVYAQNTRLELGDVVRVAFTLPAEDLVRFDTVVYAVWSLQGMPPPVTPVPEPPIIALLLVGATALAGTRCWKRKRILLNTCS